MDPKRRIAVGVLTHNVYANMRFELLEQTILSLDVAFPNAYLFVLDNGSTDGTEKYVVSIDGASELLQRGSRYCAYAHKSEDGNCTPGRGENELMKFMRGGYLPSWVIPYPVDVFVCSDDDMLWKPGAEETLLRFWDEAPDDLVIASGLLEPDFHWATPREVVEAGGVRVLVRDNAPHAAWTMRARDVDRIYPAPDTFGQDHATCVRLREQGLRVAQLDLAEHMGWGVSTHANEAHVNAKPLDRAKWGV